MFKRGLAVMWPAVIGFTLLRLPYRTLVTLMYVWHCVVCTVFVIFNLCNYDGEAIKLQKKKKITLIASLF